MKSFGSSLVFVWLRLWHWFGYSLVTLQEFGQSKWLLVVPLVVRGWAASLKAIPQFGIEDYARGAVLKKCNSVILWSVSVGLGDEVCCWSPPARCVAQQHLRGCLQMIDSSAGRSSAQEWQGSGVRGRGSEGAGTHIGTWEDQQQYLSGAPLFVFFF